jgi:uncharacterized protein (DUF1800 family)
MKKVLIFFSTILLIVINATTTSNAASNHNDKLTNNTQKASTGTHANVSGSVTDDEICYLLSRLTFGVAPGDIEAVRSIGISNFLNQQLNPQSIPESQAVTSFIQGDQTLTMSPPALFINFGPPAVKAAMQRDGSNDPEDKKSAQKQVHQAAHEVFQDNAQLRIMRALYSPRQLQEVMTDFWFNHFNISADKGLDRIWVGNYEEIAIRPYTMGKFRDLLGATCHHAAMLFYLDNAQNSVAKTNKATGKSTGLNENYARELMELHTLGVDGGYTQADVIQLAKILTGLGLPPRGRNALAVGVDTTTGSYFDARRHDFSDKVLLGQTIRGSGEYEIEQALDILASSPATARHISYQLAQYFVADKPPASLVRKLTARYMQSGGNIKAMLADLFTSNEFWDPQYRQAKFKNPFRYTISVLRATRAQPENFDPIIGFLRQQGMPMYGCLTPDGYKNTEDAWLNPDSLLKRIGFATSIASGRMKRICPQPPGYDDVSTIFSGNLSANTQSVINKAPDKLKLALLLGSPDFMRY